MYDPTTIANAFIKMAQEQDRPLTNMQVQKLVYFAHGWYLALVGEPLISEKVEAWTYGPVIQSLYDKLRSYKASPVGGPIEPDDSHNLKGKPIEQFLKRIFQKYGHLGGIQMSYLIHKLGTPWQKTWVCSPFGEIDNDLIREHFHQLEAPVK